MNELALFAGAGGGILGGHLLGWQTVCAVEWEPYPASVLVARQNDGILPPFPIWDDVQTFDGKPWDGIVVVVSGGFPCQDISSAGGGAGITGSRSSMWKHMARIIGEVRPQYAFIENSPMLTIRGLETVLCDLAALGFNAKWGVVSAADVGAPHLRERIWIVADSNEVGLCGSKTIKELGWKFRPSECGLAAEWWRTEPRQIPREIERGLGALADGVAYRVDELKAIGNGQVPRVAATAWRLLNE
jgi:DNA (cytosine-5)-methyltransferase 1